MEGVAAETTGRSDVERLAPRHEPPRPGEARRSTAHTTRAADVLGFVAGTSLQAGMTRTIEWHAARLR
jgi:nucleoside-diphosphate-sugar epimerase